MDLPTYFEALMNRTPPIPSSDIAIFLREMRKTPSGSLVTSKLLAGKIQSQSEAQALQAFEFLEAALDAETDDDSTFRTEIGRNRFLNEIIRILSPKYLGSETSVAVKERAIRFLQDAAGPKKQRWFPSEHSKITLVYQSLLDTGIIKQSPEELNDAAEAELQKSIFDRAENALVLKKLLASKDPNDLEAANRLIKNLVDEEAKRNERRAELHSLIDRIDTSASLLTEMLNQSTIDKELVDDLAVTCRNLRQKLGAVATETNDETITVLQASENLEFVLKLYDDRKESTSLDSQSTQNSSKNKNSSSSNKNKVNMDDLLSNNNSETLPTEKGNDTLSLADELLLGLSEEFALTNNKANKSHNKIHGENEELLLNFDDVDIKSSSLKDIGASGDGKHNLYGITQPSNSKKEDDGPTATKNGENTLNEIEKMSRELMEGLKTSQGSKIQGFTSPSKKTEKASLNQLQRNSSVPPTASSIVSVNTHLISSSFQNSQEVRSPDNSAYLDLDFLERPKGSTVPITSNKNNNSSMSHSTSHSSASSVLVNLNSNLSTNAASGTLDNTNDCTTAITQILSSNEDDHVLLALDDSTETQKPQTTLQSMNKESDNTLKTNKSNSSVNFSLNSIKHVDLEDIELLDNVKAIELNFLESDNSSETVKAKEDISATVTFGKLMSEKYPDFIQVAVIAVSNKSPTSQLLNYVFQLMPPKGMQVKLLPATLMELPPWKKTFLPPPMLTQIALILSSGSTGSGNKIKFILSYYLNEETFLQTGNFELPF